MPRYNYMYIVSPDVVWPLPQSVGINYQHTPGGFYRNPLSSLAVIVNGALGEIGYKSIWASTLYLRLSFARRLRAARTLYD